MDVNKIKNNYFNVQEYLKDKFKDEELIHLVRRDQVTFYMKKGVFPLWNELGYDDTIVYTYLKEPTLRLFGEWKNIDTKWKNRNNE